MIVSPRERARPMLSIVAPVYNEQETLPEFYERVDACLQMLDVDYEVVLINDGSTDGTAAELSRIHQQNPHWKWISFSRNFGHQTAITAGLQFARGRVVARGFADADVAVRVVTAGPARRRIVGAEP